MSRQAMQQALDALKESRDCVWMLREQHKPHLQYERHQQEYTDYTGQLERHDAAITAIEQELAKPEPTFFGTHTKRGEGGIVRHTARQSKFLPDGEYEVFLIPKGKT